MADQIIQTNSASLRIMEGGEAGPALVFLHYWGGSARTWQPMLDQLAGRVRCVAIDQRGWGGSVVSDGRYTLAAMADDVEDVLRALGLSRFVLVGHSMGGKVAQIVAARQPKGLEGLVLVAPAPPTPMPVPEAQRAGMLASYGSREGVLQALAVLAGAELPEHLRQQVIEDTLRGAPEAKRAWTNQGMIEDVSEGLTSVTVPVRIIVGSMDRVERETALREVFAQFLPQATFQTLDGIGHLSPLEAPGELSDACINLLNGLQSPDQAVEPRPNE